MRKLYAYTTPSNVCLVEEFIDGLPEKIKTKLFFQIDYLVDERNGFVEPYVKHFSIPRYKELYEIRVKAAESMVRIIFHEKNGVIYFLYAFYKHNRKDTENGLEAAYRILWSITDSDGNVKKDCIKEVEAYDQCRHLARQNQV